MSERLAAKTKRYQRRPRRRRGGEPDDGESRVSGSVTKLGDGSARFVADGDLERSAFIPPSEAGGLRHGDRVTVRLVPGRKGRIKAVVVARGTHGSTSLWGEIVQRARGYWVAPTPPGPPFRVLKRDLRGAKEGDAVEARVVEEPGVGQSGRVVIEEILGPMAQREVSLRLRVRALDWPRRFSKATLEQVEALPDGVDAEGDLEDGTRRDLRSLPHVTIDGADARDFDDAVYAEARDDGSTRVWVSIADVASYVEAESPLDREAYARSTSVYLPHLVLPMLPERLSNDLCSLRPGVPRRALTCQFDVDARGERHGVSVYPSLIVSHERLTYREAQQRLDADPPKNLVALERAASALRARRMRAGGVDLDIPEAHVIVDREGLPQMVRPRARERSHRLIEDLMVSANESVAEHLLSHRLSGLYRVHPAPDLKRVEGLAEWARAYGLSFSPNDGLEPKGMARWVEDIRRSPARMAGEILVLRSMAQARYAATNDGHFGLASEAYLHFTSPIRRYPDLLVHRALWRSFRGQRGLRGLSPAAVHCSQQERKAMAIEREVQAMMGAWVAEDHRGVDIKGAVTGVHEVGAFVRLEQPFVEGLLPIHRLGQGVRVDPRTFALVWPRSGRRLSVGDPVTVRIVRADPGLGRIDLEWAEAGRGTSGRHSPSRRSPGRPSDRGGPRARRPERPDRSGPSDRPGRAGYSGRPKRGKDEGGAGRPRRGGQKPSASSSPSRRARTSPQASGSPDPRGRKGPSKRSDGPTRPRGGPRKKSPPRGKPRR